MRFLPCLTASLLIFGSPTPTQGASPSAAAGSPTKPPTLLVSVEPIYPEEAIREHVEGDVVLQLEIDTGGRVSAVQVVTPAGHGLDEAAVEAAKQFVFSPAELDGKPIAVRLNYTHHFVLQAKPEVAPPEGGTLTGRVLERGMRKPVIGASVQALGTTQPVITDARGYFSIKVPVGLIGIEVSAPGYERFSTQQEIQSGQRLEVSYFLKSQSEGLETVVRGERDKKEVSRRSVDRSELQKIPGSFGDPIRVIQDLPGVARLPFLAGQIIVRGASPNDTGTYLDGVPLPLLYHFNGGPSVLNSEFLERVDFYPGGFGAEYGRAIGGIVDVYTRRQDSPDWHGSAKIDLIDAAAYVSVPISRSWTISAALRRSYIDLFLPVILRRARSHSTTVTPRYYDYQLKADYHPPDSRHSVKLFFFGSDDVLRIINNDTVANSFQLNQHIAFQRLMAAWIYRGDRLTVTTEPFVGHTLNNNGSGLLTLDQSYYNAGLREKLEYKFGPVFTAKTGLDLLGTRSAIQSDLPPRSSTYRPFPGEQASADLEQLVQRRWVYDYGYWVEGVLNFPFGLRLFPGLRGDVYSLQGERRYSVDPRLIARQTLGSDGKTTLKGSIGLYHEAPPIQFLDPVTGNPQLPLQAAFQTSFGFEQKITSLINVDITGFYTRRYHLAERSNEVVFQPDGTPIRVNYDDGGIGRAYGVEVFLRHEVSRHFFGWLAYTLSWSQQKGRYEQDYHWQAFDQRHILTLIGQYKFGRGWELGGRYRLVSGLPTTPYIDSTFDADANAYHPINGGFNSARLPLFQQLDLRVDKTWTFESWSLDLYLEVLNVFNFRNQVFLLNDYRFRTQGAVTDIPIFPTLGVKAVW
jgi:TonB family protein